MFGGQQNQQGQQNQLIASVDQNPYGNNPLFQGNASIATGGGSMASTTSPGPIATPLTNSTSRKKQGVVSAYRLAPKPLFSPRRSYSPSLNGNNAATSTVSGEGEHSADKDTSPRNSSSSHLFSPRADEAILSSEAFSPRQSVRKLIIDRKRSNSRLSLRGDQEDSTKLLLSPQVNNNEQTNNVNNANGGGPWTANGVKKVEFQQEVPDSPSPVGGQAAQKPRQPDQQPPSGKREDRRRDEDIVDEHGYWISPSAEKLSHMSLKELESISHFKVGRKDHGSVEFLEPVDLTGFSNVAKQIPGHIIVFTGKACLIYPEQEKPPVGKEFNVPAIVSLVGTWIKTKDTKEPVKDPNHPLYKKHLNRLKNMKYTEFVSWIGDRYLGVQIST